MLCPRNREAEEDGAGFGGAVEAEAIVELQGGGHSGECIADEFTVASLTGFGNDPL